MCWGLMSNLSRRRGGGGGLMPKLIRRRGCGGVLWVNYVGGDGGSVEWVGVLSVGRIGGTSKTWGLYLYNEESIIERV